jgi:formylmethanofuran dehydrogenase subunit A
LHKVGAFAPKIVNPGGVELWKQKRTGNATDLDQTIDGFNVTPRQIIQQITRSSNRLGLPHPVHIHTNNLGMPGNWTTTLETMKTLSDQQGHLAHIQFHSYGGGTAEEESLCSKVAPLADYLNDHPNITVDVGQVTFGQTTSMTGDGPLGYFLQQINGSKWYSSDTELESGCGISPINYRDKNFVHALQWAIGLEWYLMVDDPWQVVMSTDHPNGGSFTAYPQIIRLLMDRQYRREKLATVNQRILNHTSLADLDREYSLYEIAIVTRSGPARILGLPAKGHLGAGADADITIYTPEANYETMFSVPRYVLKGGEFVVEDHELRQVVTGKTISLASRTTDQERIGQIETWLEDNYSLKPEHYGISESEFSRVCRV